MGIITLLTDFGVQDEYVGVMKGVILSTAPDATIVDISHDIEPQDITAASDMLKAAYSYFPPGTIHVTVVDPGVGTQRAIIAVRCSGYVFLAPDNGLLSPILDQGTNIAVHQVENEILFNHPVSKTFHGRDIFAPVAGHLATGMPLKLTGPAMDPEKVQPLEEMLPIEKVLCIEDDPPTEDALPVEDHLSTDGDLSVKDDFSIEEQPSREEELPSPKKRVRIEGRVTSVDRFGNLITNLAADDVAQLDGDRLIFTAGDYSIEDLVETYAQIDTDQPVAIIGSRGYIEIAVNFGSASHTLQLGKGAVVKVEARPKF